MSEMLEETLKIQLSLEKDDRTSSSIINCLKNIKKNDSFFALKKAVVFLKDFMS